MSSIIIYFTHAAINEKAQCQNNPIVKRILLFIVFIFIVIYYVNASSPPWITRTILITFSRCKLLPRKILYVTWKLSSPSFYEIYLGFPTKAKYKRIKRMQRWPANPYIINYQCTQVPVKNTIALRATASQRSTGTGQGSVKCTRNSQYQTNNVCARKKQYFLLFIGSCINLYGAMNTFKNQLK